MTQMETLQADEALAPLFTPFQLGELNLPNRIVMAPMTRCSAVDGIPGPGVAEYYRRRAANGVGLIISEGIGIDHPSALGTGPLGEINLPVLHGDGATARWREIVDDVHEEDGVIFAQLWHQGVLRLPGSGPHPEAPSASPSGLWGPFDGKTSAPEEYLSTMRGVSEAPMTESAIADVIAAFGRSAANAWAAGFDGIAIHGGHGYLIDSFFWSGTNARQDQWGQDPATRARFAVEIVKEIRRSAAGLPIAFRFSQWKLQDYDAQLADCPAGLEKFLGPLADAGVDLFDASTRIFHRPAFDGSPLTLAGWAKKITGRPSMAVGGVGLGLELRDSFAGAVPVMRNEAIGADAIARGEFDLLGVGRALLADPEWVLKLQSGAEFNAFHPASLQELY